MAIIAADNRHFAEADGSSIFRHARAEINSFYLSLPDVLCMSKMFLRTVLCWTPIYTCLILTFACLTGASGSAWCGSFIQPEKPFYRISVFDLSLLVAVIYILVPAR